MSNTAMPAAAVDGAPLRHIVLFRFHPHTTAAEVAQVEAAFADLAHTMGACYDVLRGMEKL